VDTEKIVRIVEGEFDELRKDCPLWCEKEPLKELLRGLERVIIARIVTGKEK
jgi:hypothetical protein